MRRLCTRPPRRRHQNRFLTPLVPPVRGGGAGGLAENAALVGPEGLLGADARQIPSSRFASAKARRAKSRSSGVWAAETWQRMRALSLGTTG